LLAHAAEPQDVGVVVHHEDAGHVSA
jgi:hypothetical protein